MPETYTPEVHMPEPEVNQTQIENPPKGGRPPAGSNDTGARKTGAGRTIVVLVIAVLLAVGIWLGIRTRAQASNQLQSATAESSIPTVSVVRPRPTQGTQEFVAPGNMQAFMDTPIWARSAGYLKRWYVDMGAHVHAGQLLAELESPETDQQLQQASEDLQTAQANLKLAQITADRYNNLFQTDSVAKQDVDNAVQNAAARTTAVKSAEANVRRLQQLVGYEKISAPFDGVITARNVDVGALVDSGANTPGKELFHLASTNTLRVYVNVPEAYAQAARPGVKAYVTLTELTGRKFPGTVVRTADAIDPASRTLLLEVDVKNPSGELLPGSYASVHLALPSRISAVAVPANTLLFRSEGLRVGVLRGDHIELVPVTIGHDYGEEVELVSGVRADDLVVVNPNDSVTSGQRVHVAAQGS